MKATPYPRIALTLSCGLLAATGFLLSNSFARHSVPCALLSFSCVALGMVGLYVSGFKLREEVRNQRWPEATLAPMRRLTGHPFWFSLIVLLMIAMCVSFVFKHRNQQILFWAGFCLLQSLAQISTAFAQRPQKPGASQLSAWSRALPLRSEHWGER